MLIGEGPGYREDLQGIPFIGTGGEELDYTYLRLAGIDRAHVFVTNVVQCRCERNGKDVKPGQALIKACASNHLVSELSEVRPEIVILCGATACSLVPGINLEYDHGRPRPACIQIGPHSFPDQIVLPMYHPAAGMHDSRFMTPQLEDWANFGKWLAGYWEPPTYHESLPSYELITTEQSLAHAMSDTDSPYEYLPIDTESDEGRPYSIQFSPHPDRAYMFFLGEKNLLEFFSQLFEWNWAGKALLHNAAYDLEELHHSGIKVHAHRDTMQELYHLGNLPQGLKPAVYRVFGYRMTSYSDVVVPHSRHELESWLAEALWFASQNMQLVTHKQLKTKLKEVSKPHSCEAVLRRIMGKIYSREIEDDTGSVYDPWQKPKLEKGIEKPRLIGRDWLPQLEQAVGRMPRLSIVHAPLEKQVEYGCGDALWAGRLGAWLEKERARIVTEEWKVAC